ncbi:MAG TPA: flagellar hook capping FlgD N-terminal domain-containing protein [Clostridia bacterium]|nr:flagellar hook capping FlgD N-terminal domain-containing protein [Clostridia bacterium]
MANVDATTSTSGLRTLDDLASSKRNVTKELGQEQFMELLVQQMANQDPLSPTSDTDYIAQLAQFSMLNSINSLSDSMVQTQMYSLVGKEVYVYTDAARTNLAVGVVDSVVKHNGVNYLIIGGNAFELSDIAGVKNTENANTAPANQGAINSTGLLGKSVTATVEEDGESVTVSGTVIKLFTKDGMAYVTISNAETGNRDVAVSSIEEIYS